MGSASSHFKKEEQLNNMKLPDQANTTNEKNCNDVDLPKTEFLHTAPPSNSAVPNKIVPTISSFTATPINPSPSETQGYVSTIDYANFQIEYSDPTKMREQIVKMEEEENKRKENEEKEKERNKQLEQEERAQLAQLIESEQIASKNDIKYFSAKGLWKLFAKNESEIPWKEFKKRCMTSPKGDIVYVKEGFGPIRFLNVSPHFIRGAKRWLTQNGKVIQSEFEDILSYFEPIAFGTERYTRGPILTGFSLDIIFKTLSLPSFFGRKSQENTQDEIRDSVDGDHRFRFSTNPNNPLGYAYDYKSKEDKTIKAIRFYRVNPEGINEKVGYRDKDSIITVHNLIKLEENENALLQKLDIDYAPAKFKEFETLDEEEKELLIFLRSIKLEHIYDKLVQNEDYCIESKEELEQSFYSQGARRNLFELLGEKDYLTLKHSCERVQWTANTASVLTSVGSTGTSTSKKEETNKFFKFKITELNLGKKLGSGGYSEVYQCEHKNSNYAVKKVSFARAKSEHDKAKIMNSFKKEIYNLSILSHPNIVPLVGVCEEKDCIWILMRKFDESLKGYIANSKEKFGFTENDIVFVSKEILAGLIYLHSKNIAHCDMKSDNIVIWKDPKGRIKTLHITDFGVSLNTGKDDITVIVGTPLYHPPEIRKQYKEGTKNPINYLKADVYSFGIILWELMNNYPGSEIPTLSLTDEIRNRFPQIVPLFNKCMEADPNERISSQDLHSSFSKSFNQILKDNEKK